MLVRGLNVDTANMVRALKLDGIIVDRDTRTITGDYEHDESEQSAYFRDLVTIFAEEGVDTAFWFTYAGYNFPHHPDPQHDLDRASYGVIRLDPDGTWRPKSVFHALSSTYSS